MSPKDLRLKPIDSRSAIQWCHRHYESGSCPFGIRLAFGVFSPINEWVGVLVFTAPSSRFGHLVIEGGTTRTVLELSRLHLSDKCPKNSESRVMSVAMRLIRKLAPHVLGVTTYTDTGGYLYRAAGWEKVEGVHGDSKSLKIDGTRYWSTRAVGEAFGTSNADELRQRGKHVVVEQIQRHKYVYLFPGSRLAGVAEEHPLEKDVKRIWRQHGKWLGWPGTNTIRSSLHGDSFVAEYDEKDSLTGIWLVSRLLTRSVFRGIGMAVEAENKGSGIGTRLVGAMKARCEQEHRCLTFDCKADNPAVAFWDKHFERVGERHRGVKKERYFRYFYAC